MKRRAKSQLSDHDLLVALGAAVARERATTAALVADLAEMDARKLYLAAGCPSMLAYCVGQLGLCEEDAPGLISVARTARPFPTIFESLAEGRLHIEAVLLRAPYLEPGTVEELLAAATHKSETEIRRMLAERFPRTS